MSAAIDPQFAQAIRTRAIELNATLGLAEAARRLGLRKEPLLRLVAGAKVHPGTLAIAAASLGLVVPAPLAISSTPTPSDLGGGR